MSNSLVTRILSTLACILSMLMVTTVSAEVELPNGYYHYTDDDLLVKVMGGFVSVRRSWADGQWHINRAWNPIQIRRNISTNEIIEIQRNSDKYLTTKTAQTFVFDEHKSIKVISSGFRWQDRYGNWIEYDSNGRILRYGDNNNVEVSFQYDTFGRRSGVFDHFGNQVLWYEYDGDSNRILAIRDHVDIQQSRRVLYQYTGNRITTVIDVLGNSWSYGYTNDNLSRITNPEGSSVNIEYYPNGQAKSEKLDDGTGTTYEYTYDKSRSEYFVRIIYSSGLKEEKWFNKNGKLVRRALNDTTVENIVIDGRRFISTNELGYKTIREYDEWNNLLKITHPDNTYRVYTYDAKYSNISTIVDERGIITNYQYDLSGNMTRKTEAFGLTEQRITHYTYDLYGNNLSIRRESDGETEESLTSFTYDNAGNAKTKTVRVNSTNSHTINYDVHDRMGNLKEWRDAKNLVWRAEFDAKGRIVTITDPLSHSVNVSYDRSGNKTSVSNALSHATTWFYDANNRLYQVQDAENNLWHLEYAPNGTLNKIRDPEGVIVRQSYYDAAGRIQSAEDSSGNIRYFNYGVVASDNVGFLNISSIKHPTYTQRLKYDNRGRQTQSISILDEQTQFITTQRHDPNGNIVEVIDAEQKSTHYEYDGLNRLTRVIFPGNSEVQYDYDNRDNLIRVVNENNITLRKYIYDQKNRLVREIFNDNTTLEYTYDANDNLIQKIDAKGQVSIINYDSANKSETIDFYPDIQAVNNNAPDKSISFIFDEANRLRGYDDGVTSATYTYNRVNQKLTDRLALPGGIIANHVYTYLRNGLKSTVTGPDGITYTYSYNKNQLSSISLPGEGSIVFNEYKWAAPEKITFPGNIVQNFSYDGIVRVMGITVDDSASNTLINYSYNRDNIRNILSKTTEHGNYAYTYDERYRQTGADHPSGIDEIYTYDNTGNRKTSSLTTGSWNYNNDNELLDYNDTVYEYDQNGSIITKTVNSSIVHRYEYNKENHLSHVRDGDNNLVASYYYDPFGRRLWKEASGVRTYFSYSDNKISAELDSAGNVVRSYGYANESVSSLVFLRSSSNYYYYLNDHLGTPQQLVNKHGVVVWQARYLSFGNLHELQGVGINNIRMPGQYHDRETGLYYNRFRYYDPSIGRYMSSDVIGLNGGINTYLYAENRPLTYTDPYGLMSANDAEAFVAGWFGYNVSASEAEGLAYASQYQNAQAACDALRADYVKINAAVGPAGGAFIKTTHGTCFYCAGFDKAIQGLPKGGVNFAGAQAVVGRINTCNITPGEVDRFIEGVSFTGTVCVSAVCAGQTVSPNVPNDPDQKNTTTATEIGVGTPGVSISASKCNKTPCQTECPTSGFEPTVP